MKAPILILFVSILLFTSACDNFDSRLKVKNNSKENITVGYSKDTILNEKIDNYVNYYIRGKIIPDTTIRQTAMGIRHGWPGFIKRSANKRLHVFFINVDTLLKYNDFVYIRTHKLYIRKDYTLVELEKNNWVIEYP